MPVIRRAESRRTETPSGVATTLASPTQGGTTQALWRVDMHPGAAGPQHTFDTDQVWTVLNGGAVIELDGATLTVEPGDTIIMPATAPRQVIADQSAGFAAIVTAPAGARAFMLDGTDRGVPDWIA